jgi:SagB-type dehydrogenase family enzyme
MRTIIFFFLLFMSAGFCFSQDKDVILPSPDKSGGMPLMQALNERKTSREFAEGELSQQQLSDLLWAASGVNRPESGKMTAPTAMDDREIDIYVVLKSGAYRYDAAKHKLMFVAEGDLRGDMGRQAFTADAAVMLVFVADYSKMSIALSKENKDFYSAVDVGYISQNVYLYSASAKLASVVLGWIDRDKISKKLNLQKDQKVILTQCVGFPKSAN